MKLPKRESKTELSKLTVPKPLRDVYEELRGQHLLPLVGLLVASLIAIPVLLTESTDAESESAQATASTASPSTASTLSASTWNPGLRRYQNRLSFRSPSDPFTNGLTAADFDSSGGGGGEGGGEGSPPPAPEVPLPSESAAGESGGQAASGGSEPEGPGSGQPAAAPIEVEITSIYPNGARSSSVRYQQPPRTSLPNDAAAALTYVALNDDGNAAVMTVSRRVTSLAGPSSCVVPGDPCQRLELKLRAPETLVFGRDGMTYRIELLSIGASSGRPGSPPDESGTAAVGQAVAPVD